MIGPRGQVPRRLKSRQSERYQDGTADDHRHCLWRHPIAATRRDRLLCQTCPATAAMTMMPLTKLAMYGVSLKQTHTQASASSVSSVLTASPLRLCTVADGAPTGRSRKADESDNVGIEHRMNAGCQSRRAEWLFNQLDIRVEPAPVHDCVLRVPGHEKDFHVWPVIASPDPRVHGH